MLSFACAMHSYLDAIARRFAAISADAPITTRTMIRQLIAVETFEAPSRTTVPTLVLSGAKDVLISPGCSVRLAARWNATHVAHPNAGHDLTTDDAPWVVARIGDWRAREAPLHV